MRYGYDNKTTRLRPIKPSDLTRKKSRRVMRTSIAVPSQYQAYAVCVEFAKEWFLSKFPDKFFNSVYVEGTHSFDEFRKFSDLNQQMKRTNPLLAIIPTIDMAHNRQWIDSTPEFPLLLKRSRIEGTFFNDEPKGLYIQLINKTVLMNFVFKMRVNTRAEQLDLMEFLKLNHRAGWSETRDIALDIHVPKDIILQVAFDNGFKITKNAEIEEPMKLLEYLNTHSYIPFMYKLRCATGNKEFFLRVPDCCAHLKMEIPTMDDGQRQDLITTNYNIDFAVEIEMTAPYCYTYFSQSTHKYIVPLPTKRSYDEQIAIMSAVKIDVPIMDCNGWDRFTMTEYVSDEEDINKCIDIDFSEFFRGHELARFIEYTKAIAVSPFIFMNFIIFNGDFEVEYDMDWKTMICHLKEPITSCRTTIAIYCNRKYINETKVYLDELDKKSGRVE